MYRRVLGYLPPEMTEVEKLYLRSFGVLAGRAPLESSFYNDVRHPQGRVLVPPNPHL